jgi:hypothetical protein
MINCFFENSLVVFLVAFLLFSAVSEYPPAQLVYVSALKKERW